MLIQSRTMSSYDSHQLLPQSHDPRVAGLSGLPAAPYPPAPTALRQKSALSSAPHYAGRFTSDASSGASGVEQHQHQLQHQPQQSQSQPAEVDRALKFVSIRTSPSNPQLFAAINLQDEELVIKNKLGPMLCQVNQISFQSTLEERLEGRLWQTQQKVVSRLNPQLGPSVTATCLSWSPTTMQVATGLTTGNLCIHSFQEEESTASQEHFSIGRNKRPATAVAWRPNITSHVALGHSLGGPAQLHARKARATDFGCLLWDLNQSSSAPLLKMCHNAGVTSLEWLHGGQTLAVGCQMRALQLYDLRVSSSPPITVWEAESVQGMRVSQDILATYGALPSEPIKLWDLRHMETPLAEIKLDQAPTTLEWSRPGVLSVAMDNRILHYDVTSSKPALVGQTYAPGPVLDMAMVTDQERFLVILKDKSVRDVSKHTTAPLALSKRDGHIVHAFENHVWKTMAIPEDDISIVMKARAGCSQADRYSMHAATNIDILSSSPPCQDNRSLIELWRWIARMEINQKHMTALSSAMTLTDGGVWRLLEMDQSDVKDDATVLQAEDLAMEIFDSPARRAALAACGWTATTEDVFNDSIILKECEERHEYERAAALAVWHDNVGAAVQALDKGAREDSKNSSLLQLVSICIAGYNAANSVVWQHACSNLLQRPELQDDSSQGVAYLRTLLRFLLASTQEDRLGSVLDDGKLSLCDRVGFACRFLRRNELKSQLHKWVALYQDQGNVEGLVLTGLTLEGIKILQSFVDKTGDVQTASLVTSRVIMPSSWKAERRICSEWLDSYRGLLNSWQMWQSRAMFDVDRAELLRNLGQATKQETPGMAKPNSKQADPDVVLATSIPGQLDARCNYCSVSLSGARKQEGITNQWLSRAKDVLSCCPRCRKPLPRCSICLLSLGCLNPYMELKKAGAKNRGVNDLSSLASLPFAEWFTWCMRCKHGGHAHHLVGWFANHDTCPVSGCDCQCQFDGIEKLKQQPSNGSLLKDFHPRSTSIVEVSTHSSDSFAADR